MSSHGIMQADLAKIEQIVIEFFMKSLHIILDSRIPFVCSHTGEHSAASSTSSSSSSGLRVRDKWFNLVLGECPAALENVEFRRRITLEPMIVEVILIQPCGAGNGSSTSNAFTEKQNLPSSASSRRSFLKRWNSGGEEFPQPEESSTQIILERWIVQYEYRKPSSRDIPMGKAWSGSGPPRQEDGRKASGSFRRGKGGGNSVSIEVEPGSGSPQASSHSVEVPAVYKRTYKRTIILLRSLYCTARLLPAYRLFRLINSSNHNHNFSIDYRVSSVLQPLSRTDEAEMQLHAFTPVETPSGRLSLSVQYRPNVMVTTVEGCTPLLPQIITDYVGSPAVDPLKRFPCNSPATPSKKGLHALSLPLSAPLGSPPCTGFARRHSWSGGIHKALPSSQSPLSPKYCTGLSPSPSASPSYSDTHGSPTNLRIAAAFPRRHLQVDHSPSPRSSPLHPSSAEASPCLPPSHQKATSYDEYWFSPPFSPSPSPSPPTHLPEKNSRVLVRSESAPLSLSTSSVGSSPKFLAIDYYNQNKILLPSPSCKGRKPEPLPQTASSNSRIVSAQSPLCQGSPSEGRSSRKCDVSRPAEFQIGTTVLHTDSDQKVSTDGKDDSGQMPGVNVSSTGSPQFPFPRGSGKFPYQDEIEDDDFSCPFAVDDDETAECRSRTESLDGKGNVSKSLEIVGQTVTMTKGSKDAAVGALIHLLKSAPPLHPACGNPSEISQTATQVPRADSWRDASHPQNITKEHGVASLAAVNFHSGMEASGPFVHKTAADALEELRCYREMKDNLLSQNGTQTVQRSVNM